MDVTRCALPCCAPTWPTPATTERTMIHLDKIHGMTTGTEATPTKITYTKITPLVGCSWCERPATCRIDTPDGSEIACDVHRLVWFPTAVKVAPEPVRYPWYPLVGHRAGLRANDLVTLASAFWILANEGGTAHHG